MSKKKKKPMKKWLKTLLRIGCILLCAAVVGVGSLFGINAMVKGTVDENILTVEEAAKLQDVDCILVLGCRVYEDGVPSDMLDDRLRRSVELYEAGAAPKLLMSGDHGRDGYDEVDAMKTYAVEAGIPSENVFMDHAGFSTYESMYRAKEIFQAKKIIIVTQQYHLYRAMYIAEQLGMEAYGVNADYRSYSGQFMRDVREVLARVKDSLTAEFKPIPTYLGDKIDIVGNGDVTND
jgi:vancomycin permeability regulator SanA